MASAHQDGGWVEEGVFQATQIVRGGRPRPVQVLIHANTHNCKSGKNKWRGIELQKTWLENNSLENIAGQSEDQADQTPPKTCKEVCKCCSRHVEQSVAMVTDELAEGLGIKEEEAALDKFDLLITVKTEPGSIVRVLPVCVDHFPAVRGQAAPGGRAAPGAPMRSARPAVSC